MLTSAINTATAGLNAASQRLSQSAHRVATQNAPQEVSATAGSEQLALPLQGGQTRSRSVNLAHEVVNQQIATYDFKANLKVIEAADEMARETVNITA